MERAKLAEEVKARREAEDRRQAKSNKVKVMVHGRREYVRSPTQAALIIQI